MITAGGEKITPVPIEEAIKAELGEVVSHAMLVGDHRKHLSVILTLKTHVETPGAAGNQLTDEVATSRLISKYFCDIKIYFKVVTWLRERNCVANNLADVSGGQSAEAAAAIMRGIERANTAAQSRAHRVHKAARRYTHNHNYCYRQYAIFILDPFTFSFSLQPFYESTAC